MSKKLCRFCKVRPVPKGRRTCGHAECTSKLLAEAKARAGGRSSEKKTTIYRGIPVNENGLSYLRWLRAADVSPREVTLKHRRAWLAGEDPTDWRLDRARTPETPRADLLRALREDQRNLRWTNAAIARLRRGERVENLTLGNARSQASALRRTIQNKRALLAKKRK